MAFELMNGIPIVPMSQLPARRDVLDPPFFVEWSGRKRGRIPSEREYRVIGTFRNGQISVLAVPLIGPIDTVGGWHGRVVAVEVAQQLNELHANHQIDWSGPFPVIVSEGSVRHGILRAAAERRAEAAQAKAFPPNSRISM
ncbi:MAG: hypothetical protein G01um10143_670 [Parcubacteria group bacterium Gr01-1014_3]|nr:MAG: hypothetical protein G01um10143_670 [Parcubacteria group bacterium Gr01-1014_3]